MKYKVKAALVITRDWIVDSEEEAGDYGVVINNKQDAINDIYDLITDEGVEAFDREDVEYHMKIVSAEEISD